MCIVQKPRLFGPALARANARPGQKPSQAKILAWLWPWYQSQKAAAFWPQAKASPSLQADSDALRLVLSPEPSSDLTPPPPPFASTNLSTEAQAGSIGPPHLDSPSPYALSTPNADLNNLSTLVHTGGPASLYPITPPGLAAHEPVLPDAPPAIPPPTSTTTDTQRAGPDVAAPAPHGVLASGLPSLNFAALADDHPADAVAPPEPPVAQAHVEDGSPQRKPKLVQRLKEKMHVGHGHAYS
ncbi:hypothetical protein DFH09DRAFT_1097487 [Mycena vulgaris]|nr:hypothetical protein DFH09DRAFT_1097487 [Mycena vulgaris]